MFRTIIEPPFAGTVLQKSVPYMNLHRTGYFTNKQTPWPLVRERTIPTERPPLVDEILVPTFVDRGVSCGQRGGSPTVVNLSFLDRSRYFSFK
jgi:hypothetical protein